MAAFQPCLEPRRKVHLPDLWLLSDERNDAHLEHGLVRRGEHTGRGTALVFRHYHLTPQERLARFRELSRLARANGHVVILADSALTAREWGADGIYGAPLSLYPRRRGLLRIATAHDMREIAQANRIGADAVMLSPVFPTRSHPGEDTLGPQCFLHLAKRSLAPVIALGGMDADRARRLHWPRWGGIDAFG